MVTVFLLKQQEFKLFTGLSQDPQDLPKQSYKELYKDGEEEAGRERDGRTTSRRVDWKDTEQQLVKDRKGWRELVAKISSGAPTVVPIKG